MQTRRSIFCIFIVAYNQHTFLLFPAVSFSGGASNSPRPPGPILLLRVLRDDFFGDREALLEDCEDILNEELATRPSAIFSLPPVCDMVRLEIWSVVVVFESLDLEVNTTNAKPNNATSGPCALRLI